MSKNKGQLGNVNALATLAVVLVIVGIVSVIGLEIMDDTGDSVGENACLREGGFFNTGTDVCQVSATNTTKLADNTAAFNATGDTVTGIAKIPTKLPLIVTAAVGAILIGLVVTFLLVRTRG